MDDLLSTRARTASSSAIRDLLRVASAPHVLSLAGGLPAPELFPVAELHALAGELLSGHDAVRALQYGPTEGDDDLRDLVASTTGAVSAQVLVTTGSQQAIDLLARTLLDPGDAVVVESPAYLGALQAMHGARPSLVPVPADEGGLDVDRLHALLTCGLRPKLCYVVPNFSNPSGATLPLERRRALAALAERFGFLIVEDDPYGELRFAGEQLPSMQRLAANVVRLGSSSKTLAPGLRVGWAVAPAWLVPHLAKQKQAADLHTSSLGQALVAGALRAPWYPGHLVRLRASYASRASALCDAVDEHPDVLRLAARPAGGMFAWVRHRRCGDTAQLLARAVDHGVAFVPGAAFAATAGATDAMRLSFATLAPDALRTAVGRLAQVPTDVDRAVAAAG